MRRATLALSLFLLACSEEPTSPVRDSAAEPDEPVDASLECSDEGASRACTCKSGAPGRKTCRAGKYGSCGQCAEPKRDGGTAAPASTRCRAGYYVGHMEGKYKPGFASLGLSESGFEVDFKSEALNGQPPLALTLVEEASGPMGEFYSFTVNGGCLQGLARSGQTDNPFVARLTGELDCQTGKFDGVMDGVYTLLNFPGLDYKFKGPITAQFADDELADGEWSADEPPALDGKRAGGGSGSWGATWDAERAPDAGTDPCAKIPTLDAGR